MRCTGPAGAGAGSEAVRSFAPACGDPCVACFSTANDSKSIEPVRVVPVPGASLRRLENGLDRRVGDSYPDGQGTEGSGAEAVLHRVFVELAKRIEHRVLMGVRIVQHD